MRRVISGLVLGALGWAATWGLAATSAAVATSGCDPCGRILCGPIGPSVFLTVVDDATGEPLSVTPTFGGLEPSDGAFTCDGYAGADAGGDAAEGGAVDAGEGACVRWQSALMGTYTITVSAPGYESATITVDPGTVPNSCCGGWQREVRETVRLRRRS